MPVWIQLRQSKVVEVHGKPTSFEAGDWVEVGKQTARQWLADGSAFSPFPEAVSVEEKHGTAGIMLFGTGGTKPEVGVPVCGDGVWELHWDKTLFLESGTPVKVPLISVGFQFLTRWQVVCPLWSYTVLAKDEPNAGEKELERTQAVIRDLRVPMYDTRLVFMRRCPETKWLLETWDQEGPGRLGFLRSLYKCKPLTLAVPPTWTGTKV